jgi:hypothetical protein
MGLSMIETMKIFDAERHEGIKMRVGIHTGKSPFVEYPAIAFIKLRELMEFLSNFSCFFFFTTLHSILLLSFRKRPVRHCWHEEGEI